MLLHVIIEHAPRCKSHGYFLGGRGVNSGRGCAATIESPPRSFRGGLRPHAHLPALSDPALVLPLSPQQPRTRSQSQHHPRTGGHARRSVAPLRRPPSPPLGGHGPSRVASLRPGLYLADAPAGPRRPASSTATRRRRATLRRLRTPPLRGGGQTPASTPLAPLAPLTRGSARHARGGPRGGDGGEQPRGTKLAGGYVRRSLPLWPRSGRPPRTSLKPTG